MIKLLWELNKLTYVKWLDPHLAHSKHCIYEHLILLLLGLCLSNTCSFGLSHFIILTSYFYQNLYLLQSSLLSSKTVSYLWGISSHRFTWDSRYRGRFSELKYRNRAFSSIIPSHLPSVLCLVSSADHPLFLFSQFGSLRNWLRDSTGRQCETSTEDCQST